MTTIARTRRRSGLSDWAGRHGLGLYLLVAFLLSWLPWPLVALNPDSSPMVPFGPLIAALVTSALAGGWRSVAGLLRQLGRWRRPLRWYAVALLVPVVVAGLAAALTPASGGAEQGTSGVGWSQVAATFVTTLVIVGIFEEVGWRGYALPLLQRRMTSLQAALVLGAIWATWHLPELISDPSRQRPPIQFVLVVVAQSVFLTWLYTSTAGGLPLVIVSHTVIDTVLRFVLPGFSQGSYQTVWWWLAGLWAAAALFLILTRQLRPQHPARVT
jgi:membrane protease YdiL (CAAX protease family)